MESEPEPKGPVFMSPMTDSALLIAPHDAAPASSEPSSERTASWLRARTASAPENASDLVQLLLEAYAFRATAARADGEGENDDNDTFASYVKLRRRRAASRNRLNDADDDEGEDVDEENAVEVVQEETEAEGQRRIRAESSTEDDLAAVATALEVVRAAAEQLQLKMLLKAGEQMEQQEQRNETRASTNDKVRSKPGVPMVGARAVPSGSSCSKCSRYFSPFQRAKSCQSCGHSYCPKCVSRQQLLPSRFGFGQTAVRVCDPCTEWLQNAMDRYFDAVDTVRAGTQEEKAHDQEPLVLQRVFIKSRSVDHSVVGHSPTGRSRHRRLDNRVHRHSIAEAPASAPKPKPWFSGNLRAMHVGDRQPRRRSTTEADGVDDTMEIAANGHEEAVLDDCESIPRPPASDPLHGERRISLSSRAPDISIDTRRLDGRRRSLESSEGEEPNEDDNRPRTPATPATLLDTVSVATPVASDTTLTDLTPTLQADARPRSMSKPIQPKKSCRKTKFSRSASFDFTNLHTSTSASSNSLVLPASPVTSDAGDSVRSGTGSISNRERPASKKFFDDSDIVDDRRSFIGASDNGASPIGANGEQHASQEPADSLDSTDDAGLPATVLRFAVYDVGAKQNQSLKRTLVRFGRKNIVLDRYTLEVDCAQGVVRVKSVFMHRYWAFRCDAVHSIVVNGAGSVARVFVMKHDGHGYQSLEWEFGSEGERNEFKDAVEGLKSREVRPISSIGARHRRVGSNEGDEGSNATAAGTEGSERAAGTGESESSWSNAVQDTAAFQLLNGESFIARLEDVPVTLLIGPAGDTPSASETAAVWGRLRGILSVTNYRVIFTHSPEHCHASHRESARAYVPLFAVVSSQVLHPGGRRPRSTRVHQSIQPPVVVIACKDARSMRLELEGPPQAAEDRALLLQSTINRLADAAQRYRSVRDVDGVAKVPSPPLMSLNSPASTEALIIPSTRELSQPPSITVSSIDGSPRSVDTALSPALVPVSDSNAASPALAPSSTTLSERSDAFAFFYSEQSSSNGWELYTDEREFKRQIAADPTAQSFFKFYQNARGNVCKSYPAKLLVPASMNSTTLMKVAEFRAKNRLPVVTYYHTRNRCVLVRSSQPLLGNLLSGSSSLSDQLLVGVYRRLPEIIKTQSPAAPSSRPIYIFDARKLKASTGNRLMGKGGVETPQDYPGAVVHHLNIANMYRMQSSYQSLLRLVAPGGVDDQEKAWLSSLEATRWLGHVRQVLEGAVKVARVLELEGSSALVHCSDGWDRTAQLSSLAQIMLDPFYRTIRGFAVVVEKDWCAFGHKFAERLGGDRAKDPHRSKSSPIMVQFLDAVWQLQWQFPHAFEFNQEFLLHIANALTSSLYGTFLYDSRLDRDTNGVRHRTVSVWTPVLENPEPFVNTEYRPTSGPIWPWTSTQMVKLWEGYFFQWHPKFHGCRWTASLVHHHGHAQEQPKTESAQSVAVHREREGSGELGSTATARTARQQATKSPPMHKIFLFKS